MNVKQLREGHNLSQQELADKTGIPKDRIAKWEQGKGKPKGPDTITLSKFFEELIPRGKENTDRVQPVDGYGGANDLRAKTLYSISESNRHQSEANRLQAEANKIQAKNNEELLQTLKATGYGQEHIPVAVSASFAGILAVIADIGTQTKKWKSKEEGLAALHKFVPVPGLVKSEVDILSDSDK